MTTQSRHTIDILKYVDGVLDGSTISCEYIKYAARRFRDWYDGKRTDIEFREDKQDRVINFIQKLKHFEGRFAGKPFILESWQKFFVSGIFAFYWKGSDKRVCRHFILDCGRKTGKSMLAAAIELYMVIGDGEQGAQAFNVATTREQATILFGMMQKMSTAIDPKHKYLKPTRKTITYKKTNSYLQVLASDSASLDGYNAYIFVQDEAHAAPNTLLYDVLESSQGARVNPLSGQTTTAGYNVSYPYFQTRQDAILAMSGKVHNDSLWALIYTLDEGDDINDESVWKKANPNLGVTISMDFVRDRVHQARLQPDKLLDLNIKTFNIWQQSRKTWISHKHIVDSMQSVDLSQLADEGAYGGADLSSVGDITAWTVMFAPNEYREYYKDKYIFKTYYYIPQAALETSVNRERYKQWIQQGYLRMTSGNCVDYDEILNDQTEVLGNFQTMSFAFDAWNAQSWATNAQNVGIPITPYSQTVANFNKPTKELFRLIMTDKVVIDTNPITAWMFQNVEIKSDHNGNEKPKKVQDDFTKKIDGVISMIQSLGAYLDMPWNDIGVYTATKAT